MKFNALLTFVLLICFNSTLLSQLGLGIQNSISNNASSDNIYSYKAYTAYADYKVGLKNIRLNFYPGLLYSLNDYHNIKELTHNIGFRLPIQAYILNFRKDCDCPTIEKSNNYFAQNFFIMITPTIYTITHDFEGVESFGYYEFYLGGGTGIDITINKYLKLSPIIHYQPFNKKYGENVIAEEIENNKRISFALRLEINL